MKSQPVRRTHNQSFDSKQERITKGESGKINIQVNEIIHHALRNEPIQGTVENSKNPKDLIQILATKRRKTHSDLLYRTLVINQDKELVLIIPPNLSIEIARNGLSVLKWLSQQIQEGNPQVLSAGGKIYQEYEMLHRVFGWSLRDIEEQITFDFLCALLMMRDEHASKEIHDYGQYFMIALLEHLCVPENQIPSFLDEVNRNLDKDILPLKPESGFIVGDVFKEMAEIRRSWHEKIQKMFIKEEDPGYILLSFWLVAFQNKYWSILESHHDLGQYNRAHRNEIVGKYLAGIAARIQETNLPSALTPGAIRSFLAEIRYT